jgi:hypothetical protein
LLDISSSPEMAFSAAQPVGDELRQEKRELVA